MRSIFRAAGEQPRIRGVDAVDVGVDLARRRAERAGHRDGGRVRAAPAERRDVELGRQALEAGEDHDVAGVERLDAPRPDLDDLAWAVRVSVMIPACDPV